MESRVSANLLLLLLIQGVSLNHEESSPITLAMGAGIGPLHHEIGGIENEIEEQVFPRPAVSGVGTGIGSMIYHLPISRLADVAPEPTVTAYVDMIGDAQYFPGITGHITLTQVVSKKFSKKKNFNTCYRRKTVQS